MPRWEVVTLRRRALAWLALPFFISAACSKALNYADPSGPRYEGRFAGLDPDPALRIVTFNIKFSREIDRAIELFERNHDLQNPDIIALQEMNNAGVERIARALGMSYVYYPSAFHPQASGDFGCALLVKGPIEADHKLFLPHVGRFRHLLRAAVAADVVVDGIRLRAYSVHLETAIQISASERRDQLRAIVADADRYPGPVVIAGDFNSRDVVSEVLGGAGFQWVTRDAGHTISFFAWDHVFVRGLVLKAPPRKGIVFNNNGASDHLPVWAELLPQGAAAARTGP
ncbi:MAG: endonuclease [Acidobacteria bacterium]|nr:MAG: endonuclease [Acidobacteriota bacterium]PYQ24967.1 MAG: endonuclease [Acidobacteriota bacterium]